MTREEILSMSAGKDLDKLVTEKVMVIKLGTHEWFKYENGNIDDFAYESGYCNGPMCKVCGYSYCQHCQDEPENNCHSKNYSTNIASAWEVAEKFESLSIHKGVLLNNIGKQLEGKGVWDKGYKCEIVVDMPNFKTVCAVGKSAPEAICKASLLATLESPK